MGSPERELCPPPSEEDELTLPRASINKMIKELVPSVRVAFESRELILNCCTEFIHLLSSEANEVCNQSNKKTINAEHVLTALDRLGFSDYTIEAEAVLKDCKAVAAKRRRQSTRLENLGIPEEELLRQQQELFAKGTMKGLLPDQLKTLNCEIILGNTYHLGNRPGTEVLKKAGGLHNFMGWDRALLTDSGGFQMVSLLKLAQITEEGVQFKSPYDDTQIMLTPEKSIEIQNCIGADIIMQLDDVVQTTFQDDNRVKEATDRTSRWLDRCLSAHKRRDDQNIFPIVQGLLNADLREKSAKDHMTKDVNGFAIGGLSGGEAKDDFWPMVLLSTGILDKNRPRYLMGVGVAIDLVVCVALGVDMFDCVFPTRTARFGCALINSGQLNLKQKKYQTDLNPIDKDCSCTTCKNHSRAYLHCIATVETVACHLLSVHNIAFQMKLMNTMRNCIIEGTFPKFVVNFVNEVYPNKDYPPWVVNSLNSVGINFQK